MQSVICTINYNLGGNHHTKPWVLAIDPWHRGLGFAFFEGENELIDWGLRVVPAHRREHWSLEKLKSLIVEFEPDVLVLEQWQAPGSRRSIRQQKLLAQMANRAGLLGVETHLVSRHDMQNAFSFIEGRINKHTISRALAIRYPELNPQLPPFRKPWMSEDPRMSIFDACAFALTYFRTESSEETSLKNPLHQNN